MAGKEFGTYELTDAAYMSTIDINTSDFAKGVYQVVTTTENYTDVQKLVIAK